MANPEWLEIFRSYTDDELTARIASLKKEISVFNQQSVGSKSLSRDLGELRGQLSAAVRIQKERGAGSGNPAIGITDFSQMR